MAKRQGGSSFLRRGLWILALATTIVGWAEFLWPPVAEFRKTPDSPGGADVLGQLIRPNNEIYDVPFQGWLFLLVCAGLLLVLLHWIRAVTDYLQNSRVGLSVLETVMSIEMLDIARTRAVIRRKQIFHANRRGITAYRSNHQTDAPGGRIPRAEVTQQSQVANKVVTKELIMRGSEANLEVIEAFHDELPTNLAATFLPNWLVCLLHSQGLFEGVVVTREGEATYHDEFSGVDGVYSVSSTKYPISRTIIRVAFMLGHEPPAGKVRGFLIRENVVEEVALRTERNLTHITYEARSNKLHMESLRIQWEF